MVKIRRVQIKNFRSIKSLTWAPSPGFNCLIGPGDSGKSTVIDAIDACIGARRTVVMTDVDFHNLDVNQAIEISVTLGALTDGLMSIENYAHYIQGLNPSTGEIEEEVGTKLEPVLTLRLTVGSDLEPVWRLVSKRAEAEGEERSLRWSDRILVAPTRIGLTGEYNLAWRRGSVLNRISGDAPTASSALVEAARAARERFGDAAEAPLAETLGTVLDAANDLGVPIGERARALLDAHSVSYSGGTIALHSDDGIPMHALGTGSSRLLVAGLQRRARAATIVLADEVEYGLEPHRIIRLLWSLGSKEPTQPLQVFCATHSPVAVRELSARQLFILRDDGNQHTIVARGLDDLQGTIRAHPDAFLARSVLVCEGATEVGLMRGLDLYRTRQGHISLAARGVALVAVSGVSEVCGHGTAFARLGYRSAILRDDDAQPPEGTEEAFVFAGGQVFHWGANMALEDELFLSLPTSAIADLLDLAISFVGSDVVDSHIRLASAKSRTLASIQADRFDGETNEARRLLGRASRLKPGWFKTVSHMEEAAFDVVAPALPSSMPALQAGVDAIFRWIDDGPG